MKNRIFGLTILIITMIFGMMVLSCDDAPSKGNGPSKGGDPSNDHNTSRVDERLIGKWNYWRQKMVINNRTQTTDVPSSIIAFTSTVMNGYEIYTMGEGIFDYYTDQKIYDYVVTGRELQLITNFSNGYMVMYCMR